MKLLRTKYGFWDSEYVRGSKQAKVPTLSIVAEMNKGVKALLAFWCI